MNKKRKIILNGNCHVRALSDYFSFFSQFKKEYEIIPIPMIHENKKGEIGDDLLASADVYIHQDIRKENKFGYKLSDEYTMSRISEHCKNIVIPNLVGFGGWLYPNLGKLLTNSDKTDNYCFEDYVLEEAYRVIGKNALLNDYIDFWRNYEIDKYVIRKRYKEDWTKMKLREKNWDIKITKFIDSNFMSIPMFVDAGHPSKYLMIYIGDKVLELLGIENKGDEISYESNLGIPSPLLPCIKHYYNISLIKPYEQRKSRFFDKYILFNESKYILEYIYEYNRLIHNIR